MNNIVPMQTVEPIKARTYTGSQLDLIRRTVAKDCSQTEFDMFAEACRRVGLDPFRKQIYANVYNKHDPEKRQLVIITSIDGFRAIASRNGNYRPDEDEPVIHTSEDAKDPKTNPTGIERAVVTVWKQDRSGEWHPIKGVARWDEFAPLKEIWKNGENGKRQPTGEFELDPKNSFWRKMPHLMLAKCAESQALRKGWPEDLSGIYAQEEMHHADADERAASEVIAEHREHLRIEQVKANNRILFGFAAADPIEPVEIGKIADKVLEFLKASDSPTEIEAWRERNRHGLQEFWARSPSDSLEVKKAIEDRIKKLEQSE